MAKKPNVPTPTQIIRVIGPEQGRYRGGFGTVRRFMAEVQEFNDLMLTADEIAELQSDPELKVEVILLSDKGDNLSTETLPMTQIDSDAAVSSEVLATEISNSAPKSDEGAVGPV